MAEEIVGGAVTARYTYGGQMTAWGRISQSRGGATHYYGYDPGINVRQLFDASGAVTDTYAYDAFGNTVTRTGATVNPFQYRGEEFDSALGMYYLRARYYVPRTGRFLTTDPYEGEDEGQLGACDCSNRGDSSPPIGVHHLFTYAGSEPVGRIDPSGLRFIERAEIDAIITSIEEMIKECVKDAVVGKLIEGGVYLLIGEFGVDMNGKKYQETSNLYSGRTKNFDIRYKQHGTNKVFYEMRPFPLPDSILNDKEKFTRFEQRVQDLTGGKLKTSNRYRATKSKVLGCP